MVAQARIANQAPNRDGSPPKSRAGRSGTPGASSSAITVPLVHMKVEPEHLAFFGALAVMGMLELIEWPLAAVMIGGQVIATNAHRRIVREMAAGVNEAV